MLTDDDKDDLLLSCRYGEIEDVKAFVAQHGAEVINNIRDKNENTVLHMASANGHLDVLEYLLPLISPALLCAQNISKSTALHWAALNAHLPIVQKLVEWPEGPGIELIDIKNAAGLSPLGEAENAGWDDGARWLVSVMKLDADEMKEEEEEAESGDTARDIQVEIQDASGQVAKMTISGQKAPPEQ